MYFSNDKPKWPMFCELYLALLMLLITKVSIKFFSGVFSTFFKRSFMFWVTIFSFLGFSIISFIIIIRKLVKDTLNEEEVLEKFD